MSIATELQDLNDNILDAYTAVQGKGGTVPANKNMVNLPTAINSIPSGGGVGVAREVDANGVYRVPAQNFTFSLPSDVTDVGDRALQYVLYSCSTLTAVDLSSLTTVSGSYALYYAFYSCNNLTSVDLSSLTTVSGSHSFDYAFYSCSTLTAVDLSSLTTVSGSSALSSAFYSCPNLASVDLSSLTTVSGGSAFASAFRDCPSLTSVSFPALTTLKGSQALSYAFYNCTSLTSLSFPALTTSSFGSNATQFNYMLYGVTGCTVHFPAAIQSTIGSWASVTSGFGGTNTTVLFDL